MVLAGKLVGRVRIKAFNKFSGEQDPVAGKRFADLIRQLDGQVGLSGQVEQLGRRRAKMQADDEATLPDAWREIFNPTVEPVPTPTPTPSPTRGVGDEYLARLAESTQGPPGSRSPMGTGPAPASVGSGRATPPGALSPMVGPGQSPSDLIVELLAAAAAGGSSSGVVPPGADGRATPPPSLMSEQDRIFQDLALPMMEQNARRQFIESRTEANQQGLGAQGWLDNFIELNEDLEAGRITKVQYDNSMTLFNQGRDRRREEIAGFQQELQMMEPYEMALEDYLKAGSVTGDAGSMTMGELMYGINSSAEKQEMDRRETVLKELEEAEKEADEAGEARTGTRPGGVIGRESTGLDYLYDDGAIQATGPDGALVPVFENFKTEGAEGTAAFSDWFSAYFRFNPIRVGPGGEPFMIGGVRAPETVIPPEASWAALQEAFPGGANPNDHAWHPVGSIQAEVLEAMRRQDPAVVEYLNGLTPKQQEVLVDTIYARARAPENNGTASAELMSEWGAWAHLFDPTDTFQTRNSYNAIEQSLLTEGEAALPGLIAAGYTPEQIQAVIDMVNAGGSPALQAAQDLSDAWKRENSE